MSLILGVGDKLVFFLCFKELNERMGINCYVQLLTMTEIGGDTKNEFDDMQRKKI